MGKPGSAGIIVAGIPQYGSESPWTAARICAHFNDRKKAYLKIDAYAFFIEFSHISSEKI